MVSIGFVHPFGGCLSDDDMIIWAQVGGCAGGAEDLLGNWGRACDDR